MRVVFLDRASLRVPIRPLSFSAEYLEYDRTDVDQIIARLSGAQVAIVNKVPMRAVTLQQLPRLKLIAIAATGYDAVDVEYCKKNAIAVANVRDYAVHTVPEHAFALMLALRRNLLAYRHDIEVGAWQRSPQFCLLTHPITDLNGATLGFIGAGAIGRATAALGAAFGMRVVFAERAHAGHAVTRGEDTWPRMPLPQLLRESDVVTLHCPLSPATRNLIDLAALRSMRRSALLINTARGGLVDEAALVQALDEGLIAGAGFDVLTSEPPQHGNPLLALRRPNFILTPHNAWASAQAMQFLADQLIDNLEAWAAGAPKNLLT